MIKFKSSAFCSGNQLCIEEVYNYHDCFVKVMEYIATTFVISFSQSLCIGSFEVYVDSNWLEFVVAIS